MFNGLTLAHRQPTHSHVLHESLRSSTYFVVVYYESEIFSYTRFAPFRIENLAPPLCEIS